MARAATLLLLAACVRQAGPPSPESQDVVFTRYSPLSRTVEIARRVLTPVTFRRGRLALQAAGKEFREQAVDVTTEKFALYVPSAPPPKDGYGLLVFVSPGTEPIRPVLWRSELDRHGLILVSPANAGNDTSLLDRRLPLALLAVENVRLLHPIDPQRVYVGGFSGGSRVAEIAALGYPDVFRGALLEAGSDPIDGQSGIYKPPAELFRQFQRTRLVYVTGEKDELNLLDDQASRTSMKENCVFDVDVLIAHRLGHDLLDRGSLGRALDSLEKRPEIDASELERCNARVRRELDERLAEATAALARGDRERASGLIKAIDARYGGLAAPAILDLDARF